MRVFKEKVSGKLKVEDRSGLTAALDYLRDSDMLAVQEVDRLGRNLIERLVVLNDLFESSIAVKAMEGITAGKYTERNFVLDMALAQAEDHPRDIGRSTTEGRVAARRRCKVGGHLRMIDEDDPVMIAAHREKSESFREIAAAVGVSSAR